MLTAIVLLPLVGAILITLLARTDRQVKLAAGAVSVVEFALTLVLFAGFDYRAGADQFQFVQRYRDWIPALDVQYFLGVDGLSAPMVLLTGLLGAAAVFSSWGIKSRVREYFLWLLVLQTAVMGVFASLDFVLFFVFWELELVPMYMLISIWGSGRKEYSAMKFLIFTLLGSAFMLVGILAVYFSTTPHTFDMVELANGTIPIAPTFISATAVFFLFFVAYAIKLPVWPLHTWLPDAHTDAPTAVSVMLAGVLLKMGGYGLIRVNVSMFPTVTQDLAGLLAALGVLNILYGAAVTLRQTDLKRLIAYSSVSHMGFVLLGISSVVLVGGQVSSVGLTGAALQMFTHGTITGLLFAAVGLMYDKTHSRHIPDLGGLATRMPVIASVLVVAGLASLGLPGLSGFVAEVLVFLGTFPVWSLQTVLATLGIVLTAGYILWAIQRVLFGPKVERLEHVEDAKPIEMVPLFALMASIVIIGFWPAFLTDVFSFGLNPIIGRLG